MNGQEALNLYQELFPETKWEEPITVVLLNVGETDFACRVCIAQYGMNRFLFPSHPKTRKQFDEHFSKFHQYWEDTTEGKKK